MCLAARDLQRCMINYTERLSLLMEDIVARVPTLSFIDMSKVLVFARAGRTSAEGAYATCHCVCLPPSEPGYYFWRDRAHRPADAPLRVVRHEVADRDDRATSRSTTWCRSRCRASAISCSSRSRKQVHYRGQPNWVAKLDTIVHELYHIDPERPGIRRMETRGRHLLRQLPRRPLLRRRRRDGEAVSRLRSPIPRCPTSCTTTSTS